MATKMKRLSLHLRTILLLIWLSLRVGDSYSCPYGQNCGFEPAPRGRAPACAQPGLTYCVHPEPYPEKIIRQLIEAGQYDIRTLLSDEIREDFTATKKTEYPYDYGPNSLPHVDQISLVNDYSKDYNKFNTRYNHDTNLFSHKTSLQPPSPVDPVPYNVNSYQAANFSKFGYHGYSSPSQGNWQPDNYNYEKRVLRNGYNNFFDSPSFYPNYEPNEWFRQAASGVTRYNPNEWWKYVSPSRSDVSVERSVTFPTRTTTGRKRKRRNAELVNAAAKRTLTGAEALRIALGFASSETSAERPRRQADGSQSLCGVRTEFITPRAALNNKGSWKYVVNMPNDMTQLVRAEICTSTECSGLCSVPTGYTSKCEQKYLQKRLVALQANGQNLYTDVFWIPSCCQCTITPTAN